MLYFSLKEHQSKEKDNHFLYDSLIITKQSKMRQLKQQRGCIQCIVSVIQKALHHNEYCNRIALIQGFDENIVCIIIL